MNLQEFKESLVEKDAPAGVSIYLQALWYEAKGQWDKSHQLIQDVEDKNAA